MHTLLPKSKAAAPQRTVLHFSCESLRHTLGSRSRPASYPALFPCFAEYLTQGSMGKPEPAPGASLLSPGQRGGSRVQPPTANAVATAGSELGGSPSKGQRVPEKLTLRGDRTRHLPLHPLPYRGPLGSLGSHQTRAVPPRPAKWRPLSPPFAPGHSPRSAAAVSRGTPGPPCRHRGGVVDPRAQPGIAAPLRGPLISLPSRGSPRT